MKFVAPKTISPLQSITSGVSHCLRWADQEDGCLIRWQQQVLAFLMMYAAGVALFAMPVSFVAVVLKLEFTPAQAMIILSLVLLGPATLPLWATFISPGHRTLRASECLEIKEALEGSSNVDGSKAMMRQYIADALAHERKLTVYDLNMIYRIRGYCSRQVHLQELQRRLADRDKKLVTACAEVHSIGDERKITQ